MLQFSTKSHFIVPCCWIYLKIQIDICYVLPCQCLFIVSIIYMNTILNHPLDYILKWQGRKVGQFFAPMKSVVFRPVFFFKEKRVFFQNYHIWKNDDFFFSTCPNYHIIRSKNPMLQMSIRQKIHFFFQTFRVPTHLPIERQMKTGYKVQ